MINIRDFHDWIVPIAEDSLIEDMLMSDTVIALPARLTPAWPLHCRRGSPRLPLQGMDCTSRPLLRAVSATMVRAGTLRGGCQIALTDWVRGQRREFAEEAAGIIVAPTCHLSTRWRQSWIGRNSRRRTSPSPPTSTGRGEGGVL